MVTSEQDPHYVPARILPVSYAKVRNKLSLLPLTAHHLSQFGRSMNYENDSNLDCFLMVSEVFVATAMNFTTGKVEVYPRQFPIYPNGVDLWK